MKRFMAFFPLVIVLSSVIGIVVNAFVNNEAAVQAYFLALMGWGVLAYENIVEYRASQKSAK